MSQPRNNLDALQRRAKSVLSSTSALSHLQTTPSQKTSKFKPGKVVAPGSAAVQRTSGPTPAYGRAKPVPPQSAPVHPAPSIGCIDVYSSDSAPSSPTSGLPVKRASPDIPFSSLAPAHLKRQKLSKESDKENRYEPDVKGKGKAFFDEFAVEPIDEGIHHITTASKVATDIENVSGFQHEYRSSIRRAVQVSPQYHGDHIDLKPKSLDELRSLYEYNHDRGEEARREQRDFTLGKDKRKDIYVIQQLIHILDERNDAIRSEIVRRDTASHPPVPAFPSVRDLEPEGSSPKSAAAATSSTAYEDALADHISSITTAIGAEDGRFVRSEGPSTSLVEDDPRNDLGLANALSGPVEAAAQDNEADLWAQLSDTGHGHDESENQYREDRFIDSFEGTSHEAAVTYEATSLSTDSLRAEAHDYCAPSASTTVAPNSSPYYAEVREKLTKVFSLKAFRTNQLEAIIGTLAGQDVLVLMPTGGGKSLCYQLPAVCTSVLELQRRRVDAQLFTGEQDVADRALLSSRLLGSEPKPTLVYITPEKLHASGQMTRILKSLYSKGEIARFVVDEAHLISSWGRDFRDSYVALRNLRRDYPDVPIMALTATATGEQQRDIVTGLGLRDYIHLTQSFNRSNLRYSVVKKPQKTVDYIHNWITNKHPRETGIIYCGGRDKCEKVAKQLRDLGGTAKHFHAEMDSGDKLRTMAEWKNGVCKVIVATIAFGMGIDKPDVRFVIHHDMPSSLAGYNQETGRAGRDGNPSDCLLLYAMNDYSWQRERIRKDESLTEENKQRQYRDLDEMNQFCTNTTDCRRRQLLVIFHEKFDPSACNGTCDNCACTGATIEEDVTDIAADLIDLVQSSQDLRIKITRPMAVDAYRGSRKKELLSKQADRLVRFGDGKNKDRARVDRTLQRLIEDGVLETVICAAGSSGYSATYIGLGAKSEDWLTGKSMKLVLKFRAPSRNTGPNAPVLTQTTLPATKRRRVHRELEDDPIEPDEYENNDEPSRSLGAVEDALPAFQSSSGRSQTDQETQESMSSSQAVDPVEECYAELCRLRKQIATNQSSDEGDIYANETLQVLSAILPGDKTAFDDIISTSPDSVDASDKYMAYGAQFLGICTKYSMLHSGADPTPTVFRSAAMHHRFDYHETGNSSKPSSRRFQ